MKRFINLTTFILVFSLILISPYTVSAKVKNPKGPLSRITFIHYKRANAKPDWAGNGKNKDATCYTFLAKNAKWKVNEQYLINPSNTDGLSESFVYNSITTGVSEWENYGGNIFGDAVIDKSATYITSRTDDKNTVSFGSYSDNNVIAVTSVWGYFSGRPNNREIVEWDMLFNEYWSWGNAEVNSSLMDLLNIATHELGHSAGLGDIYETLCQLETMYGYSSNGDISKRDLNVGDIDGIEKLYK